jgi:soluble lytic murein transglycosylase-like protein
VDLARATARSAVDLGLNIRILTALIFVESTCRTNAVSSKDAVGPAQVNWRVWRQYTRQQLLDPETNVRVGSKILAGYVRLYGLREGLHAYNGFGDPTSAYADKVLLVAGYRIQ